MPLQTDSPSFLVDPSDLRRTCWAEARHSDHRLGDGQARIELNRFSLTTNNITYAKLGFELGYWRVFPTRAGWAQIPVWGFGTVAESRASCLSPGQRLYGLFPMARNLVVQPRLAGETRFIDTSPHRQSPGKTYDEYTPVPEDPMYDPAFDREHLVFRPLFLTSFLLDDLLSDQGEFGADEVWLLSASSKTALGLAYLQTIRRRSRARVVGVTSDRNVAFLRRTGYFDDVMTYETAAGSGRRVAIMDFSGDIQLLHRLHEGLGAQLVYSCRIGFTGAEAMRLDAPLPGPKAVFFFAPDRILKRREDWGTEVLQSRYLGAWRPFATDVRTWLTIRELASRAQVQDGYSSVLAGHLDAASTSLVDFDRVAQSHEHA